MRKLLIALLSLCSGLAAAQAPGTGNYNFASFDNRGFDQINLGNLNVRFTIPIVSRTGRGVPFNYTLQYEGLVWKAGTTSSGSTQWLPDPNYGFSGQLNGTGFEGYLVYTNGPAKCTSSDGTGAPKTYTGQKQYNYTYHDQFGIAHVFNFVNYGPCGGNDPYSTGDGTSKDNSGYTLNLNNTTQIFTRSGATINPALSATGTDNTSFQDSNGNFISSSGGSSFTDTLGQNALSISGSSPRVFTYPVTLQSNNATTASTTLSYRSYTVRTNFQFSGISDFPSTTVNLPDRVTYPDGTYYAFTYEGTPGASDGAVTGRLGSVTLPTGGTISFTYLGSNNGMAADGTPVGISRGTTDGTRTYARTSNGTLSSTTTLTDEKNNQTWLVFAFDSTTNRPLEQHRRTYQGSQSNGSLLLERYTCYNGAYASCDAQSVTIPVTQTQVVENFNSGSSSVLVNTYDPNGTLLLTSAASLANSPNLAKVTNTYSSLGNILTSVQADGNGNTYGSTTYGYDETAATATSGIPQHTVISSTPGNLTSVTTSTSSSASVKSSTTYYDTGQPTYSTAIDGGVTSYNYDSTQTFATTITLPGTSSGVSLATTAQYDTSTTAPISVTGMNSDTTKVTQYDALMRPASMTLPSGSVVTQSYSGANTITKTQTLDSSRTATSITLLDSYGRVSRVETANGQASNPWYQVDYCYDATGLLQFQSVQYQSTGFGAAKQCSGNGNTYAYDALGRVTSVANPDGTTTTTYQNRAVETVDVSGVAKINQYDVLGRLTGVCEVSSTSYGGQSPAACGMDIAANGYVTSYNNVLAQQSTTVTQGAQTRTFQTDWIGRTVTTTEPERGATSYAYAYTLNGLQVTRTRPKQNQTNASVYTHTTTQYDRLSRVTGVSYDDGITPNKAFYYDQVPSSLGWSTSPSNILGRMAAAATTANTGMQFSYDTTGNVTQVLQCSPTTCGGSSQAQLRYVINGYDQAGAMTLTQDATSGIITYGRTIAEETTSVTNNSYTDATNTPNLITNTTYGPAGITDWTYGNGLFGIKNYDALNRKYGFWVCSGANKPGCGGGSQLYGNTIGYVGNRTYGGCDTILGGCWNQTVYDDLNRLTLAQPNWGAASFTYSYDRYGNRLTSSGASYSYNAANNQQTNFGYDAAGNQLTDASHSYTYDAEGKVLKVDGGTTATYVYDALDHRISKTVSGSTQEYSFDEQGRRRVSWTNNFGVEGRIYWDGGLLADRSSAGQTFFHHANYQGTERLRTNYQGNVFTQQTSGPFGENFAMNVINNYATQDNDEYTGQERDAETNTEHFQYRQYSEMGSRWQSPDPYDGSYSAGDPQSLNRYSYVENNPLSYIDPDGLDPGDYWHDQNGNNYYEGEGGVLYALGSGESVSVSSGGCTPGASVSCGMSYQSATTNSNLGGNSSSGGGGGYGGATGGRAPSNGRPNTPRTPQQCAQQALKKNAVAIGLDVAGVGAGFLPGGDLVVAGAQATISVASGVNSAVGGDGVGSALGVLGLPATFTSYAAKTISVGGKALPGVGAFISGLGALNDAYGTYRDYQSCMAGHS